MQRSQIIGRFLLHPRRPRVPANTEPLSNRTRTHITTLRYLSTVLQSGPRSNGETYINPALNNNRKNPRLSSFIRHSSSEHGSPVIAVQELPPPSEQQAMALRALAEEVWNLIINACAGAGKTTFILLAAKQHPEKRFLILMYNSRLAAETRTRAFMAGLTNVDIGTIHSFGVRYYSPECFTDQGLKRVVREEKPIKLGNPLPDPDVIVIDELQDMKPIMKLFLDRFIQDMKVHGRKNKPPARMIALGDKAQELYGYDGASYRFLTLAGMKEVFGHLNPYPWKNIQLNASNRLTPLMTNLVNFLSQSSSSEIGKLESARKTLPAGKTYKLPRLMICDSYFHPFKEIKALHSRGVPPSDIMVLAPSLRWNTPSRNVANKLAKETDIPVHVPDFEDSEFDSEASEGKLIFCTYHQSKGIERKYVFVMNFDGSYPELYNAEAYDRLNNPLYVALTRATERLYLVQHHKNGPLPFVDSSLLQKHCEVKVLAKEQSGKNIQLLGETNNPSLTCTVTQLLRNMPENVATECMEHLELKELIPPGSEVRRKPLVDDKYKLQENIASIIGTAAPSFHQARFRHRFSLLSTVTACLNGHYQRCMSPVLGKDVDEQLLPENHVKRLFALKQKWETMHDASIEDILYVSTIHHAFMNGYINKVVSIVKFDWLSPYEVNDMVFTIDEHVPRKGFVKYESFISGRFPIVAKKITSTGSSATFNSINLEGIADIIIENQQKIIEVKRATAFKLEDIIQVALYSMILKERKRNSCSTEESGNTPWTSLLLNVLTGQLIQVSPKTEHSYRAMLKILVDRITNRAGSPDSKDAQLLQYATDKEFLEQCGNGFVTQVGKVAVPEWLYMRPTASKKELRRQRNAAAALKSEEAPEKDGN